MNKEIVIAGAGMSGLIMAEVLSANGFDYKIIERRTSEEYKPCTDIFYYHSDNIKNIIPVPLKEVKVKKFFYDVHERRFRKYTLKDLALYTKYDHNMFTNSSFEECDIITKGYIENYGLNIANILYNRHKHKIEFDIKFDFNMVKECNSVAVNTSPLVFFIDDKNDKANMKFLSNNYITYKLSETNLDDIMIIHSIYYFKRIVVIKDKMIVELFDNYVDNEIQTIVNKIQDIINDMNIFGTLTFVNVGKIVKINKIDDIFRKNILFNLTKKYNVYSLGRYAVWSYKRVDHIVNDALDIAKMIRFSQYGRW